MIDKLILPYNNSILMKPYMSFNDNSEVSIQNRAVEFWKLIAEHVLSKGKSESNGDESNRDKLGVNF